MRGLTDSVYIRFQAEAIAAAKGKTGDELTLEELVERLGAIEVAQGANKSNRCMARQRALKRVLSK